MAKKSAIKTATVRVLRPFMVKGNVVPATQPAGKDGKDTGPVLIDLPVLFAREMIANGKAELTAEKKNFDMPKEEKTFEDELAEL